ncbi:hypothetical protein NGM99_17205 [Mesorhizobium sp. RP14(2022)]|uniref:Uncharacterized protein n=1 Tax=Mesorhizobium liriopis TaxID=2953882 RepID=A0ABT1C9L2_9HYPH|nr:hypothetical protein [Mesorhizobium liriopis]MCO6051525.1 hypothetical protein [Mesorhizobium liriopis]
MAGGHGLGVDAAPDAMSVTAAFLLMKNDGARLSFEPEATFNSLDCRFELFL